MVRSLDPFFTLLSRPVSGDLSEGWGVGGEGTVRWFGVNIYGCHKANTPPATPLYYINMLFIYILTNIHYSQAPLLVFDIDS